MHTGTHMIHFYMRILQATRRRASLLLRRKILYIFFQPPGANLRRMPVRLTRIRFTTSSNDISARCTCIESFRRRRRRLNSVRFFFDSILSLVSFEKLLTTDNINVGASVGPSTGVDVSDRCQSSTHPLPVCELARSG